VHVSELFVVSNALDVTFDEYVTGLFTCENVDVVQRHFVRVPDDTSQLIAVLQQNTHTETPSASDGMSKGDSASAKLSKSVAAAK